MAQRGSVGVLSGDVSGPIANREVTRGSCPYPALDCSGSILQHRQRMHSGVFCIEPLKEAVRSVATYGLKPEFATVRHDSER
jgi:hypothetical protein